jgi:hypothetical protein
MIILSDYQNNSIIWLYMTALLKILIFLLVYNRYIFSNCRYRKSVHVNPKS